MNFTIPRFTRIVAFAFALLLASSAEARQNDGSRGSRNMELISHLPLGGMGVASGSPSAGFETLGRGTGNVVLDQQMGRPFVFISRRTADGGGIVAVNISTPSSPLVVGEWNTDADVREFSHFRHDSRQYLAVTTLDGLTILEVSDPDEGQFDSSADIEIDGGLHHVFAYRHSNGRSYLLTTGGGDILVFDIENVLSGSSTPSASIGLPEELPTIDYGYYAVRAQWHEETETDRLYAAGAGGYYVLDITDVQDPSPLASVSSAAIQIGHSISATPDGSHIVTGAGYRTAPMRIYDLRPVFDGRVPRIRVSAGAWTADWRNYAENHEQRWPFVFVASMDDGLQVFNMMNPFEPYTVGFYHTWDGQRANLSNETTDRNGAWDVDVRNSDGLIAVTDVNTGLWLFRMEAFDGWDGRGWGFANVGSVQDWENGPTASTTWN